MTHYIIAKFKTNYNWKDLIEDIKALFENALEIEGVSKVVVKKSCSSMENRADIMIEMELSKEGLKNFGFIAHGSSSMEI